jgi:DNA-binding protein H-NS
MAQTYKQIQKQIEQLQRQAETLRSGEIKGVVDRIRVAIAHYGLTAAQLGLGSEAAKSVRRGNATIAKPSAKSKSTMFSDDSGNVWAGRGPRPHWLREALKAGRSIEEFRTESSSSPKPAAAAEGQVDAAPVAKKTAKKIVKKSKRAPSKVNYTDGAGNSWTGRGPRPGWLKAAIESGKSLQDFAN